MSIRIIIILAMAMAIAYAGVYLGDGVGAFLAHNAPPNMPLNTDWLILFTTVNIIAFVGFVVWVLCILSLWIDGFAFDEVYAFSAAAAFVLLSYPFGVFAHPFTYYGYAPWLWASRLDVIMMLAFVPMAFVIYETVEDVIGDWRAQRQRATYQTEKRGRPPIA